MYRNFRPFRLQPPHTPRRRFVTLPFSSSGLPAHAVVRASPLASRLAAVCGRIEFACAADWSFTSCCSPPRLAATQLHSVTGRRTYARDGLAPSCSGTLPSALARPSRPCERARRRMILPISTFSPSRHQHGRDARVTIERATSDRHTQNEQSRSVNREGPFHGLHNSRRVGSGCRRAAAEVGGNEFGRIAALGNGKRKFTRQPQRRRGQIDHRRRTKPRREGADGAVLRRIALALIILSGGIRLLMAPTA